MYTHTHTYKSTDTDYRQLGAKINVYHLLALATAMPIRATAPAAKTPPTAAAPPNTPRPMSPSVNRNAYNHAVYMYKR